MTSPTSGVSGASGAAAAASGGNVQSKTLGDKDTFLKLLVAQLKYQDPSKPADSTQFLAQTAQFTQVEKLGDIADMLKSQRMISASTLVGHTVTYMDGNGAKLSGTISAAKLNGDSEPMLRIGNTDVLLSKVMEVQTADGSSAVQPATQPAVRPAMTPAAPAAAAPAAPAAAAQAAPAAAAQAAAAPVAKPAEGAATGSEPAGGTGEATGPATA